MRLFKLITALTFGAFVAGCGDTNVASRNAMFDTSSSRMSLIDNLNAFEPTNALEAVHIQQFNVNVPTSLKVSEADGAQPTGDIIWQGDPQGDRHAQIRAIFETAIAQGAPSAYGPIPALLDIEVVRFHGLTEHAINTSGGIQSIQFILTVLDARTGAALGKPQHVSAYIDGLGGPRAAEAALLGQTPKRHVTDGLALEIMHQLSRPESYKNS